MKVRQTSDKTYNTSKTLFSTVSRRIIMIARHDLRRYYMIL